MAISLLLFEVSSQFIPELANFVNRFYQTAESGDVTLGRIKRLNESLQIFKMHPIMGIGWNGSSYYFEQSSDIFINVHNIYAQLLCETGIIGATLYYAFFISNLIYAIKVIKCVKNEKINEKDKNVICTAFMIQVFFLLYGFTGNPLYDFQMLFPYVASCSIITYYRRVILQNKKGE
jgi:O-antigen ligase